jgi:hypothetical protein
VGLAVVGTVAHSALTVAATLAVVRTATAAACERTHQTTLVWQQEQVTADAVGYPPITSDLAGATTMWPRSSLPHTLLRHHCCTSCMEISLEYRYNNAFIKTNIILFQQYKQFS